MCVCCRPANILLDDQLNAFLGDTGFAKAAQKSGDRSGATTSVWGGAGSQGFCEDALRTPDEQTEAYAVGMTLLVVLTGRDPIDLEEVCCEACEDIDENIRFEDIPAGRLAQAGAGWPAEVADKIKQCYLQLTTRRRAKRLALATLLQSLRALLEADGSVPPPTESVDYLAPELQKATPLSLQVRRMRPASAPTAAAEASAAPAEASVQRNVAEAFDTSCAGSTNSTIRGMPMRHVTSSGASTSGAMCAGYLPRPTPSCKHSVCGAMRASTATLGSGSERGHLARRRPRSTWQRFGAPSTACAHDRSGPNPLLIGHPRTAATLRLCRISRCPVSVGACHHA